jgi:hypothetical protein
MSSPMSIYVLDFKPQQNEKSLRCEDAEVMKEEE